MKEIFFKLVSSNENILMVKFLLIPLIFLILFYVFLMIFIRIKFFRKKSLIDDFFLHFQFSKLYTVNTLLLFLNAYSFYLLYSNDFHSINWSFIWEIENIYLQIAPIIISNLILIFIFNKTKKTILNIL